MKAIAVNGSPRKSWNTATLLEKALEGAASKGAETKLVHLYELDYKGCKSCFACKTRGSKSYARCAMKDGLSPLLKEIESADILILGSPIYIGAATGEMRSFLERLLFPFLAYTNPPQSLAPRKIKTAFVYTMNVKQPQAEDFGYARHLSIPEKCLGIVFGHPTEAIWAYDTLQFDDYSKVMAERFDPKDKARSRAEDFPKDCQRAFETGARLAAQG